MRTAISLLLAGALAALGPTVLASPSVSSPAHSTMRGLVGEAPAAGTPHVLDGQVSTLAQVGDTIILGGTFTRARNDDGTGGTGEAGGELTRTSLLAFDARTGRISESFVPLVSGPVNVVIAADDGESVYVGGDFDGVDGVPGHANLVRLRVSDGAVIGRFAASTDDKVFDLHLSRGRLWVAGKFTEISGHSQVALATVDPSTGRFERYMRAEVSGIHAGGVSAVSNFDITPDGSRLVAIGNFSRLEGRANHQLLVLDLTRHKARPADFRTTFYRGNCPNKNYSYVQDVDLSPDGRFFVVSTTGAYGGAHSSCDTTARFETRAHGSSVRPSWVDYTGGDTTWGVEVTADAVYVGGHQRWQNNPYARDEAGPGAVPRPGLAALDPVNGLPYTWNPTRTRGIGVFDFLPTDQGLWVASDTDRIGDYIYKARIALLPGGGSAVDVPRPVRLPADVYLVRGGSHAALLHRTYGGPGKAGALHRAPRGDLRKRSVRGAFMLGDQLYTARRDGSFVRQPFDGHRYGAPVRVDTADQLVRLDSWHRDVAAMTGMFYDGGRIYFTRRGSHRLYYRYFTAQSGVVGAQRFVAGTRTKGADFADVRGMFSSGKKLYWVAGGDLHRLRLRRTAQSLVPVAGSARTVDAGRWPRGAMFLFRG